VTASWQPEVAHLGTTVAATLSIVPSAAGQAPAAAPEPVAPAAPVPVPPTPPLLPLPDALGRVDVHPKARTNANAAVGPATNPERSRANESILDE
jgi:hypothetical protein